MCLVVAKPVDAVTAALALPDVFDRTTVPPLNPEDRPGDRNAGFYRRVINLPRIGSEHSCAVVAAAS